MKAIKLISIFILTLFCQVVFSQNNEIVKSFNLQAEQSVERGLNSINIAKALEAQFKIPEY